MRRRVVVLCILLTVSFPSFLLGQLTSGTVSGIVTDSGGAVIPGASVTATGTTTGVVFQAETNGEGQYVLTGLPPSVYRLSFKKSGFESYVQEGLTVTVGQHATINAQLQVGAASENVTVQANGAAVNLENPTTSFEINTEMTQQLPLNGRVTLQLAQLAPDSGPTQSGGYQQAASRPDQSTEFVGASGGRGDATAYYLDGALNEDALTQIANVYPDPDAIQEFSFDTSNYNAKFAGRGGGVMNAVTRGGANQFHGGLFEFLRNSDLNGRNYFDSQQDGLKRNQFGGTIGGPIRRDKTFFFFSYQGTSIRQNPIGTATVFTAAQRAGNFSSDPQQLVNPSTGQPFPGNQVPVADFDPIASQVLAELPVGAPGTGLAFFPERLVENDKQFVARVDENVGSKLRLYGSYIYDGLNEPSTAIPGDVLTAVSGLGVSSSGYWQSQFAVLNATYTMSPYLTTTVVGSMSRRTNLSLSAPGFKDWTGFGANIPDLVTPPYTSLNLSITNYFGVSWDGSYQIPATEGGISNYWTWLKGKHTIEFGGDVLWSKVVKDQDFNGDGTFNFTNELSGDNGLDFLLSRPSQFLQQASFYIVPTRTLPAAYANDTWRVAPRLVLTLGVRWNPFVPVYDSAFHDEAIFSPSAYAAGVHSSLFPTLPPGLLVAGDPGVPSRVVDSNYHLFLPNLGFAWDVFGDSKTSLRGGFALYEDQMTANTINPNFSPFNVNVTFDDPASLENPYQGQFDPFPVARPAPATTLFQIPEAANPFTLGLKDGTIEQWNLALEQQVPKSTVLHFGYEGTESYHLQGSVEGNAAIYDPNESLAANLANINGRRPMGQYYQGLALGRSEGTASFNALIISAQRQTAHGMTYLLGYRWSKCIDESEEAFMDTDAYASPNIRFDRGPCSYNVTNQFKASFVWQLPSVSFSSRIVNAALNRWGVSGILTLQSGQPFSIESGVDNSTSGIGLDRADIVGNPHLTGRSGGNAQKAAEFFNTQAFTVNAPGTYGDTGRDLLSGPGFEDLDLALVRSFKLPVGEAQFLQFRAESFNLFNRVNFETSGVNSTVSAPSFGAISTANDPRILQFALKYSF